MATATSVNLDAMLKERVQHLAQARRRSAQWIMPEAIAHYVEREALRRDTLAAWNEHQATGLHATAADVEIWLESWGTDDEKPAPPTSTAECERSFCPGSTPGS